MPIHDWSKVRAGVFHNFHQAWTIEIYKALNRGLLPPGYFAMAEQVTAGPIPDVVCLETWPMTPTDIPDEQGGIAVAEKPPAAKRQRTKHGPSYTAKANRIVIRQPLGEVVAVIEIVSPGNKTSRAVMDSFTGKATELLARGIHLLIVDLFPPGKYDPQGIHHAIWEALGDDVKIESIGKPLTVAAYTAGEDVTAYVDGVAVGDELPSAPIFIKEERYVPVPLEETYQATWADLPIQVRQLFGEGN